MTTAKVLLVDDVSLFLEIEKNILGPSPVQILTARNGEEALHMVRSERPALVVMDLNMPRMDGAACCIAIKRDPEICSTPIIMVTNASRPADIEACRRAGCNDYIPKPVDAKLFLDKARRFLPLVERREPRFSCQVPVTITDGNRSIATVSEDLSNGGIFVATGEEFAPGAEVVLSFLLPTESAPRIVARAKIAWVNSARQKCKPTLPAGIGVEFIEITDEGLAMLRAEELKRFIEAQHALR